MVRINEYEVEYQKNGRNIINTFHADKESSLLNYLKEVGCIVISIKQKG